MFITGAGRGIGEATARLFASRGWFVGLTDIDADSVAAVATSIGSDSAWHRVLDVTDYDACVSVASEFCGRVGGRVDLLVNNAGLLKTGPWPSIPRATAQSLVDVNVSGVLNGTYALFEPLKATANARIVNLCSSSACYGVPEFSVYSATKFFVRGLTEALNIEFAQYGILVNDVLPPFVATEMLLGQESKPPIVGRMGITHGPEQVAKFIWRAAHGRRVHYVIKPDQRLYKNLAGFEWIGKAVMRIYSR
jgi:NAD(P)-dependent dehydrogenase (short-subunit alcohol dehydrogenase family)